MKVFLQLFAKASNALFRLIKVWFWVYLLNLVVAFAMAWPLKGLLGKTVGDSLAINDSLERFDYGFLSDFLREYGLGFSQLINQSWILVLVFVFFIAWLSGAIVHAFLSNQSPSASAFWQNGTKYFWRMLRMTLYFLLIQAFVFFLAYKVFSFGGLSPFEIDTDTGLIKRFQWSLILYAVLLSITMLWSDYSKVLIVKKDQKWIFNEMIEGLIFPFKQFKYAIPLFLLCAINLAIAFALYYFLRSAFTMNSDLTIFLALILGQIFIFARVGIRLLRISCADQLIKQKSSTQFNEDVAMQDLQAVD